MRGMPTTERRLKAPRDGRHPSGLTKGLVRAIPFVLALLVACGVAVLLRSLELALR